MEIFRCITNSIKKIIPNIYVCVCMCHFDDNSEYSDSNRVYLVNLKFYLYFI